MRPFPDIRFNMNIRTYQPGDKQVCLEIFDSNLGKYFDASERAEFSEYLASQNNSEDYFVCTVNDKVVACGGFGVHKEVASLCWGMVHREYHSSGYGTALTDYRINKLKKNADVGVVKIETSQHTKGFYQNKGFVVTAVTKDGFGAGIDSVAMSLEVNDVTAPMKIVRLNWQQTIDIRHKVLWPHKDPSFCKVEGDETGIHYGAKIGDEIACVASVYINGNSARLRKFATVESFQKQGIGSAMLKHMLGDARSSGISNFWFDARESALDFYRKFGFEAEGERFYKSDVAYFKMSKTL